MRVPGFKYSDKEFRPIFDTSKPLLKFNKNEKK